MLEPKKNLFRLLENKSFILRFLIFTAFFWGIYFLSQFVLVPKNLNTTSESNPPVAIEQSKQSIASASATPILEATPSSRKQTAILPKKPIASVTPTPSILGETNNTLEPLQPSVTAPTPTPVVPSPQPVEEIKLQVFVSVDQGAEFSVQLPTGKNQCDVLSQALAEGKISSLTMKYFESFGSQGVYVINGLGNENQVWWTYVVNGKSPSTGCSQQSVSNNDHVNWIYVGRR